MVSTETFSYGASGNITDTFAYDTYGKLISRTGTSKVIFGYNGRDGVGSYSLTCVMFGMKENSHLFMFSY